MKITSGNSALLAILPAICLTLFTARAATAQQAVTPEMRAKARQTMMVCRSDYQKFCSGVPRGNGRILACLNENSGKLQPDCATALKDLPAPPQT